MKKTKTLIVAILIFLIFIVGIFIYIQHPRTFKEYYERGNSRYEAENYEGAITDYTKSIELDDKYPWAYFYRGISKYSLGRYIEAIDDFSKTIDLDSNATNAYGMRGLAKDKLEQGEKAFVDYKKAIKLKKTTSSPYYAKRLTKELEEKYKKTDEIIEIKRKMAKRDVYDYFSAAYEGNLKIINELIGAGNVNVRHPHTGAPIISLACQSGQLNIVRALIKAGANVNLTDNRTGLSPLITASGSPDKEAVYKEIVKELIKAGANVHYNALDRVPQSGCSFVSGPGGVGGCTALKMATVMNNNRIADILRQAGARR